MPAHCLYKISEMPFENAVDVIGTAVRQKSRKSDLNVIEQYRNSVLSSSNPNTEKVKSIRRRSSNPFVNKFSETGKETQIFFPVSDAILPLKIPVLPCQIK